MDLTTADNLYITFAELDGGAYKTLNQYEGTDANITVAAHKVTAVLDQATTLAFPNQVYAQINWIEDSARFSSKIYMHVFETPVVASALPPVTPDPEE